MPYYNTIASVVATHYECDHPHEGAPCGLEMTYESELPPVTKGGVERFVHTCSRDHVKLLRKRFPGFDMVDTGIRLEGAEEQESTDVRPAEDEHQAHSADAD